MFGLKLQQAFRPIPKTFVKVVFPEYTEWENRGYEKIFKKSLDFKQSAEAIFSWSWRKPACARTWPRGIEKGDFIHVDCEYGKKWMKLTESLNGKRQWDFVEKEDVFS